MMASSIIPARHDLVFWRGRKWLVTRSLRFGRVEIALIEDPTVIWVCLAERMQWDHKATAWILLALPMPTRGTHE